jgi:low temperature requirement protein LtrA
MAARATDEPHRASSHLELLFDLTFVVAISRVTPLLTDGIANGDGRHVVTPFLEVFFLIWWAWMNFTWFASSYDTDDVSYRLLTLVQMAGVLVLAAGVPSAVHGNDLLVITVGYLLMRAGLIALWLRAAIEEPADRATALRYATGLTGLMVAWLLRLVVAETGALPRHALLSIFIGLVVLELSLPLWLELKRHTSWHPHHIAERYGLFAILLLGEAMFAGSSKVETAIQHDGVSGTLVTIAVAGLIVIFALWWLYFLEPAGEGLARNRDRAYLWGCFGQYGVFAALAGLGAGLGVAIEQVGHQTQSSPTTAGYAVAVPVALFLVLLWAVSTPFVGRSPVKPRVTLGGVVVIVLAPLAADDCGVSGVVAVIAAVCASMIATSIFLGTNDDPGARKSVTVPPAIKAHTTRLVTSPR